MPEKRIDDIFIENLEKYLKRNHMTYSELAQKLGISKSAVSMWKKKSGFPRIEILDKIADLFQISTADLFVDGEHYIIKNGEGVSFNSSTGQYESYNGSYIDVVTDTPTTIAAHLDTDDLTEAELEDVAKFIEFVKSKRKD